MLLSDTAGRNPPVDLRIAALQLLGRASNLWVVKQKAWKH